MTTGSILQDLRIKQGFTQEAVASFLKINRVSISHYEANDREAPIEVLEELSNLYGVTLNDFFETNPDIVKTNIAFAFRADELTEEDLHQIADIKKIVKNYFKILNLEKKIEK
jgi:transcriptional regulator with XRE-family HTH domain